MSQPVRLHPAITHKHFDIIDSTNNYLLASNLPCPCLVSAKAQTAGRGRRGKNWISGDGNLLFSLSTKCPANIDVSPWPIQVAITMAKTLKRIANKQIFIKWPNDLYVQNPNSEYGKFAGILTESRIGKNSKMITGIGINLSSTQNLTNAEYLIANLELDINYYSLLATLVNELYWQWQDFLAYPQIDIKNYACYDVLFNKMLIATDDYSNKKIIGQGCGVNDKGQLLIQQHGELINLTSMHSIRLL